MKKPVLFLLIPGLWMISCKSVNEQEPIDLVYPVTEKVDHVDTYHGTEVSDPYQWLEDDLSEETAQWVAKQNDVTFGYLDNIPFREAIKDRIEYLLDYERGSAPFKEGLYDYFYKNDGLQNHSVLYRRPAGQLDAEAEVFLDPNTFSEDGTIGLTGISFSEDGTMAAYLITEGGSDWRKIIVLDAMTKEVMGDTLVDVKFSGVSWWKNEGFYYSSYDKPKDGSELSGKNQYHKLYFHKLGTTQDQDELIYGGAKQPNLLVRATVTEDQQYLVISTSKGSMGNQMYVKDLTSSASDFIPLEENYETEFNFVDNVGAAFYINTNIDAPKYRLVRVRLDDPSPSNWEEIIPESEDVLRSVGTAGGKIFANYLVDAKTAVKQYDLDGNLDREVELPGIGSASGFGGKKGDMEFYYSFTSFTYPSSTFKYDIATGESERYGESAVDFNPEEYETKQIFYSSKDGTKVPMFIVHKKGLKLNGKNPTYLYAYGGFNISQTPRFRATQIVWLENGGIYAVANIRGGGEYGEEWHMAGTQMNKQNVFDDFIAAGEYLINEGYTSSDYLAIAGGSNGGLLVGATMTQRPDLAKVALPAVGVMDMLKYHTFTIGAAWATDYGTAEDSPEMFEYLRNYSPYHALKPGVAYPATLVTTADHDDRVVPAHSFKFAARLQECHVGENPVLVRIETKAGHGSVSTEQQIALAADRYAFIWYNMGVRPKLARKVLN